MVESQVRLQKLDFWVRNPDYLANELLNDYESGDQDPSLLQLAGEFWTARSQSCVVSDAQVSVRCIRRP